MEYLEEQMTSMIGQKVILKRHCLGNPVGTVGYVFNEYPDFDEPDKMDVQVVFQNGACSKFSVTEQFLFLKFESPMPEYAEYKFKNVMQVRRDFESHYWKFGG
jgi:hypothetical protein